MPITLGNADITSSTSDVKFPHPITIETTEADIWLKSTGPNTTWRIIGSTGANTHQFRIYDQTNGADRLTVDSSGRIRKPSQPAFCAHEDGGSSYSNNVTIVFPTVKHNAGSHYNSGTGVFTAPVAGRYFFYSQLLGDASGSRAIAYLSLNNSTGSGDQTVEMSAVTTQYNSCTATVILDLAANDNVRVRTGGSETNFYGGSSFQNIFCGYLIG